MKNAFFEYHIFTEYNLTINYNTKEAPVEGAQAGVPLPGLAAVQAHTPLPPVDSAGKLTLFYVMSCHVMLCHVMFCYVMICHVLLSPGEARRPLPRHHVDELLEGEGRGGARESRK